jgi:aerobic-type carbon monoxide dehydrogenase small subunit (CoxS/CutS family)
MDSDRNLTVMAIDAYRSLEINVDGELVDVDDETATLLDVLRAVGRTSVKDGCSPQGQCGCCTVLVDGQPRVSCVTPVRRVRGREITTVDGIDANDAARWIDAFAETGGSQCGFCTPGIICRFEGLRSKGASHDDRDAAADALLAHMCRCTGWQPIVDAWVAFPTATGVARSDSASRRAELEAGSAQSTAPDVAIGRGGFSDDTAPDDALVAVLDTSTEEWAVAPTRAEAVRLAGKVQGRRTTAEFSPPIEIPDGDWVQTLRTSWTEPGYLETDAAWCLPGGEPVSPLENGGAFGGKVDSEVGVVARRLADEHGHPVRVLYSREDVVRRGPKRPPLAAGVRADGTGVVRVARTTGIADVIAAVAPGFEVEEVDVPGPRTSVAIRGAGWLEMAVLLSGLREEVGWISAPGGGSAGASIAADGTIDVVVRCGAPLDETILRSYCIGAAHMGLGLVTSESLGVDAEGVIHDLTVRSFGILRAVDTPTINIAIESDDGPPVNGSDAVMAAVAAAAWLARDCPQDWPTGGS